MEPSTVRTLLVMHANSIEPCCMRPISTVLGLPLRTEISKVRTMVYEARLSFCFQCQQNKKDRSV